MRVNSRHPDAVSSAILTACYAKEEGENYLESVSPLGSIISHEENFMVLEALFIKGAVAIAGWLSTIVTAGMVAHAAAWIAANGVVALAAALASTPFVVAAIVVGGVKWGEEAIEKVNKLVKHIANGEISEAATMLLKLYLEDKIGSTIDETVGNVSSLLQSKYSANDVAKMSGALRELASDLKRAGRAT